MKRVGAGILGGLLLLTGIALLVLPGPGFVLIAAGLSILATQFDWAAKPLQYAKKKAKAGIDEVTSSWWRLALAMLSALALAAVGVVELSGIDLPFINDLSAVLLVGSGLFLLGTVIYARRQGAETGANSAGRPATNSES